MSDYSKQIESRIMNPRMSRRYRKKLPRWPIVVIPILSAMTVLPVDLLIIPIEASVPYLHLYTGFRFIAIVVAPLVAVGAILLIRRSVPEPPGPLRTAAALAITTAVVTPLVVAVVVGMQALVPGATPLAGSVLELIAIVAVGGLLYWSPPALAIMGPLLVGAAWWLRGSWQE